MKHEWLKQVQVFDHEVAACKVHLDIIIPKYADLLNQGEAYIDEAAFRKPLLSCLLRVMYYFNFKSFSDSAQHHIFKLIKTSFAEKDLQEFAPEWHVDRFLYHVLTSLDQEIKDDIWLDVVKWLCRETSALPLQEIMYLSRIIASDSIESALFHLIDHVKSAENACQILQSTHALNMPLQKRDQLMIYAILIKVAKKDLSEMQCMAILDHMLALQITCKDIMNQPTWVTKMIEVTSGLVLFQQLVKKGFRWVDMQKESKDQLIQKLVTD